MPIRETIQLDTRQYMQSLNTAERAALRHANKQESAYKNARRTMQQLQQDIKSVERAIESSNSPESVKRYQKALSSLKADYRQLEQQTKKYDKAVKQVGDTSKKTGSSVSNSFKNIGNAAKIWIAGAAAGALYGLANAFRSIASEQLRFDQAMTRSLAIQSDVTEDQRDRMISTAREVAKELNLSSDQVAEGYFYLASAGLDAEQQIASLRDVSVFAKAGAFDLATATDLLTDAQSALGLTVKETTQNQRNMVRVSDVLAKANSMANATIQQFSEALTNKAGTAMKTYNKEVEEGVAVLAAYADQGVKANLAGERFNILLKRLAEQAQNNAKAFKDAEISVFDAEGNYRNLADIIADMERAFSGLTVAQRQSALAQLGFTAESQDAVTGLIGLSEQIRNYQQNLESAAGTTQNIADKQLASLQERLGLVKRQIIDLFGDDTLSLIENFVNSLEGVAGAIDEYQYNARRNEFVEGLVEQSPQQLRYRRNELRDEFDRQAEATEQARNELRLLTEDVDFYNKRISENPALQDAYNRQLQRSVQLVKNARDTYKGNIEVLNAHRKASEGNALAQGKIDIALAENERRLESAQKAFDQVTQTMQRLQQQTSEQVDPAFAETLQKLASSGEGAENQVREHVQGIVRAYRNASEELRQELEVGGITNEEYEIKIEANTEGLRNSLIAVRNEVRKVKATTPQLEQAFSQAMIEITQKVTSTQGALMDVDSLANKVAGSFSAMGAGTFAPPEFGELVTNLIAAEGELMKFTTGTIESRTELDNWLAVAQSGAEKHRQNLVKLQNQLDANLITEKEYTQQAEESTRTYLDSLREIYNELEGELTPELERFFSTLFDGFDEAEGKTKGLTVDFESLADSVSGILNLADSFGVLSDELSGALRGSIDLLRNIDNLKTVINSVNATPLNIAVPAIGIATGIAGILTNVLANPATEQGMNAEELQDLRVSIEQNRRALERNTQAILEQSVVGESINQQAIQQLDQALQAAINTAERYMIPEEQADIVLNALQMALDNAGMQANVRDLFDESFELTGNVSESLRSVLGLISQGFGMPLALAEDGLAASIQAIINSFGAYSKTLEGAIEEFRQSLDFTDIDTNQALSVFLDRLENLGSDIPEELFLDLRNIDLNTEQGEQELNRIIQQLFQNRADMLGELTPESFTQLLEFLQALPEADYNTLQGAVQRFSDALTFGGQSVEEAMQGFIQRLVDLDTNIPDRLFLDLESIDITTEAGQEQLDAIIADLYNNAEEFAGELNSDEFRQLLTFLTNIPRNQPTDGEVVRSVSGVAGITEFQAADINALLEAQLNESIDQTRVLQGILSHVANIQSMSATPVVNRSVNINGINVQTELTDRDIRIITQRIADQLKIQQRGRLFG